MTKHGSSTRRADDTGPYRTVTINYVGPMDERPAYHAHDYSRDRLQLDPRRVDVEDVRSARTPASLQDERFALIVQPTAVADLRDPVQVRSRYLPEVRERLQALTGAAEVLMIPRGVLRFGERSGEYGSQANTRPARFAHVDFTPGAAPGLLQPLLDAAGVQRGGRRVVSYNVWRPLTHAPQDVPLALCDARSVQPAQLVSADAVFDAPDRPHFSFESWLLAFAPDHRWCWFPDMSVDEALVFVTWDSHDPLGRVPHCAFDDPLCPPDAPPRASLEVRGFALFDD